jgi:hypothetical protein
MLSAIKINAKNDANGNPRRGWVVLRTEEHGSGGSGSEIVDFVVEGYEGTGALDRAGYPRRIANCPELLVVPGEYREMLKWTISFPSS